MHDGLREHRDRRRADLHRPRPPRMIAARQRLQPPVEHRAAPAGTPSAGSSAQMRTSIACPVTADVVLRDRQFLAARDAKLHATRSIPVTSLGHRVLDLQPRVHLQEVELPSGSSRNSTGAGALVADRAPLRSPRPPSFARAGVVSGRRRLLDDLLVTALHRAVALAQVHDVAGVGDHLELDVPRASMSRSRKSRPSPNAFSASRRPRCATRRRARPARATTRMPRPPPPAAALTMSGKADPLGLGGQRLLVLRRRRRSRARPACRPRPSPSRAPCRPSRRSRAADGPMKTSPAASTAAANAAFSARKP